MKSDDVFKPLLAFGAGFAVGTVVGRCWAGHVGAGHDPEGGDPTRDTSATASERIHALMADVEHRLITTVEDLMSQRRGPAASYQDADRVARISSHDDDASTESR
jgi:hypothetical protein